MQYELKSEINVFEKKLEFKSHKKKLWPFIKHGQGTNTEKSIKIKISRKQTNAVNASKMVQPCTGRHQNEKRKIQETGDFLPVKLHTMEIMWGGEQAENEEENSLLHFLEKMLGLFEQIK
jgi:hypothetical protein